ncbi:MAG: rhomboid family intramembrane serine protease [Candidatus Woesearchaeota archaeon]
MVTCCIKKSYNIIDISSGSSDINAALFGLFFSALLYKYSKDKRINFMSINYTIMALFFIFLFVYYSFDLKFLLLSILIFIITIILNYNIIKNFENKKFLYVITIIIILFFLLSNFPNITIIQEMKIDIISHFLGFIYGLIISWIYFYNSIEKHKLQTIIN